MSMFRGAQRINEKMVVAASPRAQLKSEGLVDVSVEDEGGLAESRENGYDDGKTTGTEATRVTVDLVRSIDFIAAGLRSSR